MAFPQVGVHLIVQGGGAFANDLRQAGAALGALTGQLKGASVGNLGAALSGLGKAIGGVATTALGIGLYHATTAALDLIPEIERLTLEYAFQKTVLTSLLALETDVTGGVTDMTQAMSKASPVADKLFNSYQDLAIASPFKTSDIITARVVLQTYDIANKQLETLVPRLVDVGTLRGWTGDKLNRAAIAFGQVASSGRLMGQEALQLAQVAVPAYQIVAEYLGITTAAAKQMGFEGKISTQLFFDAFMQWSAGAEGAATRFAHTLPGLISSVEDLREINLREFGVGFGEAIMPALEKLVGWLNDPAIQQGFHNLGTQMGESALRAVEWGQNVIAAFGYWNDGIISLQTVADVILPGLGDHFAPFLAGIEKAGDWIGEHLPQAMDFLRDHSTELMGALSGIETVMAGGLGLSIITGLLTAMTSPLGLLIEGAALLGAAWAGNWGGIQEKTAEVWSTLGPMLEDIGAWLEEKLPIAIEAAADFWTNNLYPALQDVGAFVTDTLIPKLGELSTWFEEKGGPIAESLGNLWNEVLLPALEGVAGVITDTVLPKLGELIDKLATGLPGAIDTFVAKWNEEFLPAMEGIGTHVDEEWNPAIERFSNAFAEAFPKAWSVWEPLLTGMGQIAGGAFAGLGSIIEQGLIEKLNEASRTMEQFSAQWDAVVSGLPAPLTGAIASMVGAMAGMQTSFSGAIAGIVASFAAMQSGFSGMVASLVAGLAGMQASFSGTLASISVNIAASLASWQSAMSGALASIVAAVATGMSQLQSAVSGALATLVAEMASAWNQATSIVSSAASAIGGFASSIVGFFGNIISAAQNLVGALQGIASAIASIVVPDWALGHSPPPLAKWFTYIAEAIQMTTDSLPAMMAALKDDDAIANVKELQDAFTDLLIGGYGAEANMERQKAKNLDAIEGVSDLQRIRVENELKNAEFEAGQIADPEQAAKYYRERSAAIFELAKLTDNMAKAEEEGDEKKLARLRQQYELISSAQQYEARSRDLERETSSDFLKVIEAMAAVIETAGPEDADTPEPPGYTRLFEFLAFLESIILPQSQTGMAPQPLPAWVTASMPMTPMQNMGMSIPYSQATYTNNYNYAPTYGGSPTNEPQRNFDMMKAWGL